MLILHGGNRSPFVRRIAIWLRLQERPFEQRPVSVFGDGFEEMLRRNPVGRVPVLTTEEGEDLIETAAIIDYLEDTAPLPRRLIPPSGPDRRRCLQRIAYANSVTEKAVALVYEVERRPPHLVWPEWRDRLAGQVRNGVAALEAMLPEDGWLGGEAPDGSDAAAVSLHEFLGTVSGFDFCSVAPKLSALAARAHRDGRFTDELPARALPNAH